MNKLKKLNGNIIIFLLALILLIIYKSIDNLAAVGEFFKMIYTSVKPFITAFLIAYILNMPCKSVKKLLEKTGSEFISKRSKGFSILIVYILALIVLTVTVRTIVPKIYENCLDLYKNFSVYLDGAMNFINGWLDRFEYNIVSLDSVTNALLGYVKKIDVTEFSKYAQGVINFTSGIMNTFISIIASVYMLLDSDRIKKALKYVISVMTSNEKADRLFDYFRKINDIFSKYIYCKIIETVIVGAIATVMLLILNVKYAILLGIFIGFLNLIPYFGSIISTVCVVLITLVTGGVGKGISVAVVLLILEQIDGNYIGPKILNNVLEIRPLWVIFSVAVFGNLFGVIGMLISVPVLVVLKMLVSDYLKNRENAKIKSQEKTAEQG